MELDPTQGQRKTTFYASSPCTAHAKWTATLQCTNSTFDGFQDKEKMSVQEIAY